MQIRIFFILQYIVMFWFVCKITMAKKELLEGNGKTQMISSWGLEDTNPQPIENAQQPDEMDAAKLYSTLSRNQKAFTMKDLTKHLEATVLRRKNVFRKKMDGKENLDENELQHNKHKWKWSRHGIRIRKKCKGKKSADVIADIKDKPKIKPSENSPLVVSRKVLKNKLYDEQVTDLSDEMANENKIKNRYQAASAGTINKTESDVIAPRHESFSYQNPLNKLPDMKDKSNSFHETEINSIGNDQDNSTQTTQKIDETESHSIGNVTEAFKYSETASHENITEKEDVSMTTVTQLGGIYDPKSIILQRTSASMSDDDSEDIFLKNSKKQHKKNSSNEVTTELVDGITVQPDGRSTLFSETHSLILERISSTMNDTKSEGVIEKHSSTHEENEAIGNEAITELVEKTSLKPDSATKLTLEKQLSNLSEAEETFNSSNQRNEGNTVITNVSEGFSHGNVKNNETGSNSTNTGFKINQYSDELKIETLLVTEVIPPDVLNNKSLSVEEESASKNNTQYSYTSQEKMNKTQNKLSDKISSTRIDQFVFTETNLGHNEAISDIFSNKFVSPEGKLMFKNDSLSEKGFWDEIQKTHHEENNTLEITQISINATNIKPDSDNTPISITENVSSEIQTVESDFTSSGKMKENSKNKIDHEYVSTDNNLENNQTESENMTTDIKNFMYNEMLENGIVNSTESKTTSVIGNTLYDALNDSMVLPLYDKSSSAKEGHSSISQEMPNMQKKVNKRSEIIYELIDKTIIKPVSDNMHITVAEIMDNFVLSGESNEKNVITIEHQKDLSETNQINNKTEPDNTSTETETFRYRKVLLNETDNHRNNTKKNIISVTNVTLYETLRNDESSSAGKYTISSLAAVSETAFQTEMPMAVSEENVYMTMFQEMINRNNSSPNSKSSPISATENVLSEMQKAEVVLNLDGKLIEVNTDGTTPEESSTETILGINEKKLHNMVTGIKSYNESLENQNIDSRSGSERPNITENNVLSKMQEIDDEFDSGKESNNTDTSVENYGELLLNGTVDNRSNAQKDILIATESTGVDILNGNTILPVDNKPISIKYVVSESIFQTELTTIQSEENKSIEVIYDLDDRTSIQPDVYYKRIIIPEKISNELKESENVFNLPDKSTDSNKNTMDHEIGFNGTNSQEANNDASTNINTTLRKKQTGEYKSILDTPANVFSDAIELTSEINENETDEISMNKNAVDNNRDSDANTLLTDWHKTGNNSSYDAIENKFKKARYKKYHNSLTPAIRIHETASNGTNSILTNRIKSNFRPAHFLQLSRSCKKSRARRLRKGSRVKCRRNSSAPRRVSPHSSSSINHQNQNVSKILPKNNENSKFKKNIIISSVLTEENHKTKLGYHNKTNRRNSNGKKCNIKKKKSDDSSREKNISETSKNGMKNATPFEIYSKYYRAIERVATRILKEYKNSKYWRNIIINPALTKENHKTPFKDRRDDKAPISFLIKEYKGKKDNREENNQSMNKKSTVSASTIIITTPTESHISLNDKETTAAKQASGTKINKNEAGLNENSLIAHNITNEDNRNNNTSHAE